MDLKRLQERVVQQEARALDLGMASHCPNLIEELQYTLHDVNALRAQLSGTDGARDLCARADSVYAELIGLLAHRGGYMRPSFAA